MKFQPSQSLGVIALLFVFSTLAAQNDLSIYIDDKQVETTQVIDLDVRVTNYNDIVSSSFMVTWDSMVLRYTGVDNIAFGLSEDDNFNTMDASGGAITYLYFDHSLSGNSLADSEILFTLQLEVIGMDGQQTEVLFDGLMEVVDTSETALPAEFNGAVVTIGEPNSVSALSDDILTAGISPNPFSGNANVLLQSGISGELTWTLSEINGQKISTGVKNINPGTNNLELRNTLFKHTGSYILQLQLDDAIITKRLLYVEP